MNNVSGTSNYPSREEELALAEKITAYCREISSPGITQDPRMLSFTETLLSQLPYPYPRSRKGNSFIACTLIFSPIFYIRLSSFKEVFDADPKDSTERRKWTYTSKKILHVQSEIAGFYKEIYGFSVTIYDPPVKAVEGALTDISEKLQGDQNQARPPVVFIHQDPGKPIGTLKGELHRHNSPENGVKSFDIHENPHIEGPFIKLFEPFKERFRIFPDGRFFVSLEYNLKEVYVDEGKFKSEHLAHVAMTIRSNERIVF